MAISTPTEWNSSSITVTLRGGTFKPGEKAYLYVVDAANTPSTGYPITIGGTPSGSVVVPQEDVPSASIPSQPIEIDTPSNLRIVQQPEE
jgi:hypothetical protein